MHSLPGTSSISMASIPHWIHAFSSDISQEFQPVKQFQVGIPASISCKPCKFSSSPKKLVVFPSHLLLFSFLCRISSTSSKISRVGSKDSHLMCGIWVSVRGLRTPKPLHRMLLDPECALLSEPETCHHLPMKHLQLEKICLSGHIYLFFMNMSYLCSQSQDSVCLSAVGRGMA